MWFFFSFPTAKHGREISGVGQGVSGSQCLRKNVGVNVTAKKTKRIVSEKNLNFTNGIMTRKLGTWRLYIQHHIVQILLRHYWEKMVRKYKVNRVRDDTFFLFKFFLLLLFGHLHFQQNVLLYYFPEFIIVVVVNSGTVPAAVATTCALYQLNNRSF